MQQKRDGLVPIREAFSDLNDGPGGKRSVSPRPRLGGASPKPTR